MRLKIDDLGVVGIIVDDWSFEKSFKPKTIVTDYRNWRTYISRRAVPKHIELTDSYYWKPILKPFGGGSVDAFTRIKVGNNTLVAVGEDEFELIAGENVTIEADPETKKITINVEGEEQVQSDWNQTDDEAKDYIKNKPVIPQGVVVDDHLDQTSENPVQNKIIAAEVSDLQEQIDALVIGGATVDLSASPLTVLVGVQRSISLSARTDTQPTGIKIERDGAEIASGSGLTLSYNDSITPATAGNISYLAEFSFGNTKKTASKNVAVVYPVKYGAGDDYTDAISQASARTTPAGTYTINVQSDGDYVFFVVPANMNINGATLSGFDFPLQSPVNVVIDGVAYKYYKSKNTYDRGLLIIIIS